MSRIVANRLARICAYSSQAPEWEQLVRLITPEVALTARRLSELWGDPSEATISEIVQSVFVKLCEDERRVLREFEDRGGNSFLKLVRIMAATVATDQFRRAHAGKRGGPIDSQARSELPQTTTQNLADARALEAVQWRALIAQLDGLLRLHPDSISGRDRNLFWLYYRHGMSAEAISRIPAMRLSAKGVESALKRMRRLLREKVDSSRRTARLVQTRAASLSRAKVISSIVAIERVKEG